MKLNKGFTLIELLVVIAIISILAAIIFPVYGRVKDSAYRSSDMSNMNSIRTALQLYRTDQGGYPPAILGYASGYMDFEPGEVAGDIVPANMLAAANPWTQNSDFMYPKRISAISTLQPSYDRASNTMTTTAFWPTGLSPQMNPTNPQESSGPDYVERCADIVPPNGPDNGPTMVVNYYYSVSGYDVETLQVPGSGPNVTQTELHYSPFWSQFTVPTSCDSSGKVFTTPAGSTPTQTTGGSSIDSPRQLGYSDPPETTVVTWDSFFRDYNSSGNVTPGEKREIVLFLGGSARLMDSVAVSQQGWQVTP